MSLIAHGHITTSLRSIKLNPKKIQQKIKTRLEKWLMPKQQAAIPQLIWVPRNDKRLF